MAISKSQLAATAKYQKSHYDKIMIRCKIGGNDALKRHAAMHDKSVNAFIMRAIRQTLIDDGADLETIRAICGD